MLSQRAMLKGLLDLPAYGTSPLYVKDGSGITVRTHHAEICTEGGGLPWNNRWSYGWHPERDGLEEGARAS